MPDIIVPWESEAYVFLDTVFQARTFSGSIYLRLYKADITPSNSDVYSTYSGNECNYAGYSAKALTRSTSIWNLTIGTASNKSYIVTASGQTFTCSSNPSPAQYAYGWYLSVTVNSVVRLICAQKFESRQFIHDAGTIEVTPKIPLADPIS